MKYTQKQRQEIAQIINDGIDKAELGFAINHVTSDDILYKDFVPGLIGFTPGKYNPIKSILNKLSKNRYKDFGQFHHFKNRNIALNIIQDKSIQLSSLLSNHQNDFAEYSEYYKRLGLFYQLTPYNYAEQLSNKTYDPSERTPADDSRDNIFIICFTQDNHNEKFWEIYADKDQHVSIGFKFLAFKDEFVGKYDFRDVFYDSGYSFEFLNYINFNLRQKFGKYLFVEGSTKFSTFYKRGLYNWEHETRLKFHYDFNPLQNGESLNKIFPIQELQGRRFIEIPLCGHVNVNPMFDLTISEVVCGNAVPKPDYERLKNALKINFPDAYIWQRP